MLEFQRMPGGVAVDAVDWLSSGSRSGLVRVRGRREPAAPWTLPALVVEHPDGVRRFASLPDPRAERDAAGWRGAYVLDAALAAAAAGWALEWPGGLRSALPRPDVSPEAGSGPAAVAAPGGQVVERAVLAERRARRAEAAEQAQARIAREALRAVEVLEVRAAEVEERLLAAEAERDVLRARAAPRPVAAAPKAEEADALRAELDAVRAQLARLEAQPRSDPERQAERLRDALAATVAEMEDLRLRLHEAQVTHRTREVAWSADAVRLAVLDREHADLRRELERARDDVAAAREQQDGALRAVEDARAATAGAVAAHAETRRRFMERVVELRAARERIAALEGELAAVRAEAARGAADAADAAREAVLADVRRHQDEVEAAAAARAAGLEDDVEALQARLVLAETELAEAETARERAEARAVAAARARQAGEVRRAALAAPPRTTTGSEPPAPADAFAAAAARLRAAREPDAEPAEPAPPPVPPEVVAAAAGQAAAAAAAAEEQSAPGGRPAPERLLADLDAAAEQLRRRASAGGQRMLRDALVLLAREDPGAAARLLAGLLPAQHAALEETLDYDLTIRELGTFAVATGPVGSAVTSVPAARGRRRAAFHLRADALALAEVLAGGDARPRRFAGPLRMSGHARRARALERLRGADLSLADAVRAGAELDALPALRCLAHAVHPDWTRGHAFLVEIAVDGAVACVQVGEGEGLRVTTGPAAGHLDARVRMSRGGFRALLAGDDGAEPPGVEGDAAAVARLRGWVARVAG